MKQIGIRTYYLLFIYIFFFKYFVNGEDNNDNSGNCAPYFTGINEEASPTEYKCFSSVDECKTNQYYYYNSFELKCWKSGCPSDYYTNELNSNNLPSEDISRSTCVRQCSQNFPKYYKDGVKICKKNCGTNEFVTIDEPNICKNIEDIDTNTYQYIAENDLNKYIKECHYEKFIYTKDGKQICVSNCKEYNKFFVTGNQNCLDNCNGYPYYDEDSYQCLDLCLNNKNSNAIYSPQKSNSPQKCKIDISSEECYYESNYTIYSRSSQTFFKESNEEICYPNCNGLLKQIPEKTDKYYCISECNEYRYRKTIQIAAMGTIYYTECVNSCNYHIKGSNICIDECPTNYAGFNIDREQVCVDPNCKKAEKFDESAKECKIKSTETSSKYIYKEVGDFKKQNTYVWTTTCVTEKPFIKDENDPECVDICPVGNDFLEGTSPNIECLKKCSSGLYIKSENYDNKYECVGDSCPTNYYTLIDKIDNTEKIMCSKEENSYFNYIMPDKSDKYRYSSCQGLYEFYYKLADGHIECRSNNPCDNENNKYYFEGECLTGAQCTGKNKLYVEDKICVDQCKEGHNYKKLTDNIYICGEISICDNMYIDSGNYCIDKCPQGKNFIVDNKYCKSQCDSTNGDHYYLSNEGDSYPIYICSRQCPSTEYIYQGYNTNECFKDCTENLPYKLVNTTHKICYDNCLFSSQTFTLGNDCTEHCSSDLKFYYEKEKKCLSECKSDDFANKITDTEYECIKDCKTKNKKICQNCLDGDKNINICVEHCTGNKPYIDGDYCVDHCPPSKRYFDKTKNQDIECLIDCPVNLEYYEISSDDNGNSFYGCIRECTNYYGVINDAENKLKAKECINACPSGIYNYKLGNKECVIVCPEAKPYHLDGGIECLTNCEGTEKKYHEINQTICKMETDCLYTYIDYEEKLCLSKDQPKCPSNKIYSTKIGGDKIVCSNTCSYSSYTKSTPYNTCVNDCSVVSMILNQTNNFNSHCTCENLYYINSSLQVECIPNSENKLCKQIDIINKINLFDERIGSKECVQTCNGSRVLSLKEDICYDESYTCDKLDDKNTKLITKNNGQRKCDCEFRFYYGTDNISLDQKIIKICLDNGIKCHSIPKEKYVPETKECTNECPNEFKYEFQNYFCLRDCPKDSILEEEESKSICKCVSPKKYWHKISSGNFECLDTCHDKYPVYAPYNNRCLPNCKDSYFPIFYENKCYRSCANNPDLNIVNGKEIEEDGGDLYQKTCKCEPEITWYRNESHTIICSNNQKDCKHFENPDRTFKYLIYDTWECVDECPDDYPYIFNEGCFKNCNHAAKFYEHVNFTGIFECQCTNLWYNETREEDSVSLKRCIAPEISDCIFYSDSLKYKINTTNECVEKCPDEMYVINFTCNEKCPAYTKDNERDKNCSCNTNMGYWYEFEIEFKEYNKKYSFLGCGVDECPYDISDRSRKEEPDTRQYLLKSEKKCLNDCKDDAEYKFNYKNICIRECPYLTKIENNNNCSLYDLNDSAIKNREQLKGATNVQAPELYYNKTLTKNENKDEFLFNKFNVSIHIYGVDRKNSYKNIIDFGSDKYKGLSYIDFSTCLNKLFLDKSISEDEQILIAKYDILNESNLINRVEYELFSNRTSEKLDALVCNPYEILVSYPLFLERYDEFEGDDNNNEYLEKFNIGKALYEQDNTINTFDLNNYIYKNFCRGLEYNGKDLVFEDRYKNLYPNKMLICENNCTIKNTDFENKRVNCLCTYKKEFDFDRKEDVEDIFNNPNFYIPTQSSANAEAIKCLSNFTVQQTVAKNEAFYYCFFITAVEVALGVISSIIGINTITNFIKPILNKIQNKDFRKKDKPSKNIGFKTDNIITSTNQPLNNPPKRNNIYKEGDDEIDNEEVKNNNNDTLFENDIDSNDNKDGNYEINIKKGNNKTSNNYYYKAEYIPQEYNTKFFKPTDKGVIKKIDRSKLPFKIAGDTKYLIEKRKGIEYDSNYLYGQYSPSQNILIITDGNNTDITNIVKYIKSEKLVDNKLNKNDMKLGEKKIFGNLNTNYSKYTDKDFITVKKIKNNFAKDQITDNTVSDIFEEDSDDMKVDEDNAGLFTLIKREQLFLRLEYKKYLEKKHPNNMAIFISEILDKIYIVKICLFLKKYDIFTHHLSLYLLCHVLLMSLLCGFFTVKVIKKIWDQTDFPGIGFYILYGLISHIIIWIVYQIFLYIIDFRDKIKELVLLQKELKLQESNDYDDNIDERNEKIFNKKYKQIISSIKCTIVVFYIIIFIIILFCTIYLISFFALYTGTKKKVLKSYYISLIEILIIKFVYGFSLASLRTASRINKMKKVYKIVYICDKYIS